MCTHCILLEFFFNITNSMSGRDFNIQFHQCIAVCLLKWFVNWENHGLCQDQRVIDNSNQCNLKGIYLIQIKPLYVIAYYSVYLQLKIISPDGDIIFNCKYTNFILFSEKKCKINYRKRNAK